MKKLLLIGLCVMGAVAISGCNTVTDPVPVGGDIWGGPGDKAAPPGGPSAPPNGSAVGGGDGGGAPVHGGQGLAAVVQSPRDQSSVREGTLLDLQAAGSGGRPPYQYAWFMDTEAQPFSTEQNPVGVQIGAAGEHHLSLVVRDSTGAESSATIGVVATALEGDMRFWVGNLHSHTYMSHGADSFLSLPIVSSDLTPEAAYEYARWSTNMDFYAITDHDNMLFPGDLRKIRNVAQEKYVPGAFVPLVGFEWSHMTLGHINVFGTDEFLYNFILNDLIDLLLEHNDMSRIYEFIDENGALAQFNHPLEGTGHGHRMFESFNFYGNARDNMFAIETGNTGDDVGNNTGAYFDRYIEALDKGWRLAPTNNHDNHDIGSYIWEEDGQRYFHINSHRTVCVNRELTRESIFDCMRSRRIYSTDDPDTEIVFMSGGAWMGEEIQVQGGTIEFSVKVTTNEPIRYLEIISNQGEVVAELAVQGAWETRVLWSPVVPVEGRTYFFLRVTETDRINSDGPEQVAVTAPIWVR